MRRFLREGLRLGKLGRSMLRPYSGGERRRNRPNRKGTALRVRRAVGDSLYGTSGLEHEFGGNLQAAWTATAEDGVANAHVAGGG